MYEMLIRLMVAAALLDLGHALVDTKNLTSRSGLERIDQATRAVLHIDWKPISVFPEEAERFKKHYNSPRRAGQSSRSSTFVCPVLFAQIYFV